MATGGISVSTVGISVATGGISAVGSVTGGISVVGSTGGISVPTGGISVVGTTGGIHDGRLPGKAGGQAGLHLGGVTTVTYRDGVYTHPLVGLPRRRAGGSGGCVHVQMLELQPPRRP